MSDILPPSLFCTAVVHPVVLKLVSFVCTSLINSTSTRRIAAVLIPPPHNEAPSLSTSDSSSLPFVFHLRTRQGEVR